MQSIAEQIKGMRQALGLSQEQLAERSGLSQSMIADIENRKRQNLTTQTVEKLAEALNCNYISHLLPKQDIRTTLEEQSLAVAKKIVLASAGSMAIEMQTTSRDVIDQQISDLQKQLLTKHRSSLWQKI